MKFKYATKAQIKYIEILFQDLGFNFLQKEYFIKEKYKKNFTDELFSHEATELIADLKERKENVYARIRKANAGDVDNE